MNPQLVVLMADYERMKEELKVQKLLVRDGNRRNEDLAAQNTQLKKDLRNYLLREDSHNRKRKQVDLIHDENEVNEELSGQDALDQIQAYKRVAREKSLHVGGLDFRAGRLVPDRRVRLAAIVRKLGPFVQGGGQSGQEQVECLD
jgi:hypothetical protein